LAQSKKPKKQTQIPDFRTRSLENLDFLDERHKYINAYGRGINDWESVWS